MFCRYFQSYGGYINGVYSQKPSEKTLDILYLIPDEGDGTPNCRNRITTSKQFISRIKNMNKIELESVRKKS